MPDPEKVQVEVQPEPEVDETQGSVVVDLEAKPTPTPSKEDELVKKLESTIDAKYGKLIKNLENQLSGARRIIERQERQLQGNQKQEEPQSIADQQKVYQTELDRLKDTDPWKAVELMAEERAKKLMEERESKRQLDELQSERLSLLETSKQEVIKEYPELDPDKGDPDSEITQVYTEVLNSNPKLLSDPYGPVIAAREMEKIFLQRGVDIPLKRKRDLYLAPQSKATPRRAGVEAGSLPPGRSGLDSGKYTLTPDEKAMCETYGIPLEEYARTAKALSSEGQVTT